MIYVSQIQFSLAMKDYIDKAAAGLDTILISLGFNVCISITVCASINYEDANRKKDNQ